MLGIRGYTDRYGIGPFYLFLYGIRLRTILPKIPFSMCIFPVGLIFRDIRDGLFPEIFMKIIDNPPYGAF